MSSDAQRALLKGRVVELSAYRSGRHSSRGMPVSISSCTILSAGTALALRHLLTACGQTPIFRAKPRKPNSLMARSIADFCSIAQVSTVGIPLSTDSVRGLRTTETNGYRLQMVDVSSCGSFSDFLRELMRAQQLTRKDLEQLLGVGKAMIEKYLNKNSVPGDDKLQLICDKYPEYGFQALHDLANNIKRTETEHTVRTEFGARIGRLAESIQDETLRFALFQLVSSLERDSKKGTGTK